MHSKTERINDRYQRTSFALLALSHPAIVALASNVFALSPIQPSSPWRPDSRPSRLARALHRQHHPAIYRAPWYSLSLPLHYSPCARRRARCGRFLSLHGSTSYDLSFRLRPNRLA